jgi:hypothetical protein
MRNLVTVGFTVMILVMSGSSAQACFRRCRNSCDTDCGAPAVQVQYVEKTVTCYKPEWKEREVKCTVNRMVTRTEVVPVKCNIMVPVWTDQKQTQVFYKRVPKEVEREVTTCHMVRDCVVDPCTGCTRTVCRPEYSTQKVKCTIWECIPEKRDVTVRVCSWKPEERTVETRRVICEWKPETITRKERYCEMVPYQTTVKVPVCVPAPACN